MIKTKARSETTEEAEIHGFGQENAVTERIIAAAIEVHRHLGPGLLESAYEACLCHELTLMGIGYRRQLPLPVSYKGIELDCGYKLDLIVEGTVIVELKAIEDLAPIHHSQLLTYLKLTNTRVGLLINFHVLVLKNGLKRIVNRYAGPALAPRTSASSALDPYSETDESAASISLETQETSAQSPRPRASASNAPRPTEVPH